MRPGSSPQIIVPESYMSPLMDCIKSSNTRLSKTSLRKETLKKVLHKRPFPESLSHPSTDKRPLPKISSTPPPPPHNLPIHNGTHPHNNHNRLPGLRQNHPPPLPPPPTPLSKPVLQTCAPEKRIRRPRNRFPTRFLLIHIRRKRTSQWLYLLQHGWPIGRRS